MSKTNEALHMVATLAELILSSHAFHSLRDANADFDILKEIKERSAELTEDNTDSVILITLKKGSGEFCDDCDEEHHDVVLDMVAVGGQSKISAMLMVASAKAVPDNEPEEVPGPTH